MTERSPGRRLLLAVAGWLVVAILATGVTLAVISSIGAGIFGTSTEPLDQDEIARALTVRPPVAEPTPTEPAVPSPTTPGTRTPTPGGTATAAGEPAVIVSPGGTAVARCMNGLIELLSWSPAQGFQVDRPDRGPDDELEIEFESDDVEVEVTIRCVGGVPAATIEVDD